MSVENDLAGLPAAASNTKPVNGVVQPALKKLEKIVTRLASHLGCRVIELPELVLVHSVKTAQFLLLPQSEPVFADFCPSLAMLARPLAFSVE
jgi:hypothetical protein